MTENREQETTATVQTVRNSTGSTGLTRTDVMQLAPDHRLCDARQTHRRDDAAQLRHVEERAVGWVREFIGHDPMLSEWAA